MNARLNFHVHCLFDAILNEHLPLSERNHRAGLAIANIRDLERHHLGFLQKNPGKVDPAGEVGVNLYKYSGTPLQYAAENGYAAVVRLLLRAKADPELLTVHGYNPLSLAAQNGHTETVSLLLSANANPNRGITSGGTPLIYAAQNGHIENVKLLLAAKANPDVFDRQTGTTPLIIAAQFGYIAVVRLLLDANATPNLRNEKSGTSALMQAAHDGHNNLIQLLIAAKADPNNYSEKYGTTGLINAARKGYAETVQLLLESKANAAYVTHTGHSALDFAMQQKHFAVMVLLMNNIKFAEFVNWSECFQILLASQNHDAFIIEFLKKLSKEDTAALMGTAVGVYLQKFKVLHTALSSVHTKFVETHLPPVLAEITGSYGSFDQPCKEQKTFERRELDAKYVDLQLKALKKQIGKTKAPKPGLFLQSVKNIDKALVLGKEDLMTAVLRRFLS